MFKGTWVFCMIFPNIFTLTFPFYLSEGPQNLGKFSDHAFLPHVLRMTPFLVSLTFSAFWSMCHFLAHPLPGCCSYSPLMISSICLVCGIHVDRPILPQLVAPVSLISPSRFPSGCSSMGCCSGWWFECGQHLLFTGKAGHIPCFFFFFSFTERQAIFFFKSKYSPLSFSSVNHKIHFLFSKIKMYIFGMFQGEGTFYLFDFWLHSSYVFTLKWKF